MGISFVPWQERLWVFFCMSAKEIARAEGDRDRTKQGIQSALSRNTPWKQSEGALKQSCVLWSHYMVEFCEMASVDEVTPRSSCCSSRDIRLLFSLIFPFFSAFSVPSFESFKKSKFQNQILAEKVRLCWSIARKLQLFFPNGCITLCLSCPCTFPQPQLATGQEGDGYI